MNIKTLKVGYLEENCYILYINNDYLVIDPGDEYTRIKQEIKGNLLGVLITHYHFDHIGALNSIINDYNPKLYDINNFEKENIIGPFKFEMLKTPGHKEDCVSYLFDGILFSGDFIFENTIGRCDMPGGNYKQMQESIKYILENYQELEIYPGHGNKTYLSEEINQLKNNII